MTGLYRGRTPTNRDLPSDAEFADRFDQSPLAAQRLRMADMVLVISGIETHCLSAR
jgi:hypothetical protein